MKFLKNTNKIFVALSAIIVLICVGIIIYWIFTAIMKARKGDDENPILVPDPIDASSSTQAWDLPKSSGNNYPSVEFTISFWIYIDNWTITNHTKHILHKKNSFSIGLDRNRNKLIVSTLYKGGRNEELLSNSCGVENIPIQKWVHITYVQNSGTVDVYVNCKLERSCNYQNRIPSVNLNKLKLFSSSSSSSDRYSGQLSSLRYFSKALLPSEIAYMCDQGPYATKGQAQKDSRTPTSNGGGGVCNETFDNQQQPPCDDQVRDAINCLTAQGIPFPQGISSSQENGLQGTGKDEDDNNCFYQTSGNEMLSYYCKYRDSTGETLSNADCIKANIRDKKNKMCFKFNKNLTPLMQANITKQNKNSFINYCLPKMESCSANGVQLASKDAGQTVDTGLQQPKNCYYNSRNVQNIGSYYCNYLDSSLNRLDDKGCIDKIIPSNLKTSNYCVDLSPIKKNLNLYNSFKVSNEKMNIPICPDNYNKCE